MTLPITTYGRLLLAKTEAATGVDATPDKAVNAILVDTLEITKMAVKTIDRKPVQSFMGAGAKIVTSFDSMIKCKIPLTMGADANGVPVVGTVPHYDPLMLACGMQRTQTSVVSGTAQGGTLKTITLAAANDNDDFYAGLGILTEESGAAKATGVSSLNVIKFSASSSAMDDFYTSSTVTVQHFNGTLDADSASKSNKLSITLPVSVVGANNMAGLKIAVTTGAITEKRRISSYSASTRKAVLDKPLATLPVVGSTFKLTEAVKITSYAGATKVATLQRNLKFVTVASTPYSLLVARSIVNYDGNSKIATVAPPFIIAPTSTTSYSISANLSYSLISKNSPSVTFYYYEEDTLYAFTGARGDLSISGDSNNLLFADFTFTGILDRYEGTTLPGSSAGNFADPLPINYANTNAISLHGVDSIVLKKMTVGLNNTVTHSNNPGVNAVRLSGRDVKGSITLEALRPSNFDLLETVINGDTKEFMFSHGPIGNNVTIFCGNVQLNNPKDAESDGIIETSIDLNMPAKAPGNNELKIILQ